MPDDQQTFARLINRGRHQYVVLPEGIVFSGKRVKLTRMGKGVLIEPEQKRSRQDIEAWFKELDKYAHLPFMEEGREQPPLPPDKDLFD